MNHIYTERDIMDYMKIAQRLTHDQCKKICNDVCDYFNKPKIQKNYTYQYRLGCVYWLEHSKDIDIIGNKVYYKNKLVSEYIGDFPIPLMIQRSLSEIFYPENFK
jgi:hypothetical protein